MTMGPKPFSPDMLSLERRPFYDIFVALTGQIQARYVSTLPKPDEFSVQQVQGTMLRIDKCIGEGLLTKQLDQLDEISVTSVGIQHSEGHQIIFNRDPLTAGFVVGVSYQIGEDMFLYKTPIDGISLLVRKTSQVNGLKGTFYSIKSSLIGSNN